MHIDNYYILIKRLKVQSKRNGLYNVKAIIFIAFINAWIKIASFFLNSYKRLVGAGLSIVFFYFCCSYCMSFGVINEEYGSFYISGVEKSDFSVDELEAINEIDKKMNEYEAEFSEDYDVLQDGMSEEDIETFSLEDMISEEYADEKVIGYEEIDEEDISIDSLDINDWELILVNKQHPIPLDYEMELATIRGTMQCDKRMLPYLQEMFRAAREEGISLIVCSPYRDYQLQVYLFNRKVNSFLDRGFSYWDSYQLASHTVTIPGRSEHQLGLAVDIISNTHTRLTIAFENDPSGKWLAQNAHKYGFILRYPDGKEDITGIQYEPWHFRYVGINAATVMYNEGLTLEELISELE